MVSMALVTTENEPPLNRTNSTVNNNNNELQIVVRSPPITLPDGWLVEKRLRRHSSDPNRVDRYYIEPHTGQKFRSLISVQRYLSDESRNYLPKRMISENNDTIFIKSGNRKFRRPASDFEGGLTEENARKATPKLLLKCGSRKRPSVKSYENPVEESFSVAEDQTILKPSIQPLKKIKTREDNRTNSFHNLTTPPTKVSWVLSGPGGFWNPFLDDSIVPTSEKSKWSKAFSISINEGVTN
ncbi:methyl-CpG-binding domain-containing protein 7-like isoform X2 [Trifolium pratense]|uniref:methyl-CpG-binding domain-containing protein 7-like isoform X2 n=1 Tax=Trifolium pratense TaxID=57577 RepID=UPI001E692E93|nr:methyl-CpG-binding domain-containing protein 7-like isoform X2 [Trifolium pratense]